MLNPYSGLTAADFQQAGLRLLPPGRAFSHEADSFVARFFGAVTDLFAAFHAEASNLVDNELFPPLTQALLPDWEAELGLPDPCTPQPQLYQQRIAALVARITDLGNLSRQKYIDLAASLGFTITITEHRPSSCLSTCISPIYDPSWRLAWQVNAPATTVVIATCLDNCTSPLRSWGNAALECAITRMNRPSRIVLFSYGN